MEQCAETRASRSHKPWGNDLMQFIFFVAHKDFRHLPGLYMGAQKNNNYLARR
jgi:hypothetical protein